MEGPEIASVVNAMGLDEYRRKRDFTKTPEPPPERVKSRAPALSYLVQKHDATRLHYDFRLELDGVLLSWAVTKGPSLNPAGHLSFILHGKRLTGGWDLVRMRGDGKRENWLLIKKAGKPGGLILSGIAITHPDRVISDLGHITKGAVAEYYAAVARFLLPGIARRPLSLLRCPAGIDGGCFYQRNLDKGLGPDVHPFKFRQKGKTYEYLYIEDVKGLLEVIQMGAIELHPWGASIDSIDYPDWLIFDLDPAPEVPFEALKLAAQDLRQRLKHKGLTSTLKCTGGKGLHVTVPLAAKDRWPAVKSFAAAVAREMVAAAPAAYVATMSKAKRTGKIFIDYFRNDYTATAIADYAVRARPGAPVALPLQWTELADLQSASQFTMPDVLKRVKTKRPARASRQRGQRVPPGETV